MGDAVQRSYEETGAFHAQETEAVHGEQGSDDQVLVFFKNVMNSMNVIIVFTITLI